VFSKPFGRLCGLGLKWRDLSSSAREAIQAAIAAQASYMITQGLSTTLYGLGIMEAPWPSLSPATVGVLQTEMQRCFGPRSLVPASDAQAVANSIYALGFSQLTWGELPEGVRAALMKATVLCGPYLKAQELANLAYG
jgi:hypothetical protein